VGVFDTCCKIHIMLTSLMLRELSCAILSILWVCSMIIKRCLDSLRLAKRLQIDIQMHTIIQIQSFSGIRLKLLVVSAIYVPIRSQKNTFWIKDHQLTFQFFWLSSGEWRERFRSCRSPSSQATALSLPWLGPCRHLAVTTWLLRHVGTGRGTGFRAA